MNFAIFVAENIKHVYAWEGKLVEKQGIFKLIVKIKVKVQKYMKTTYQLE